MPRSIASARTLAEEIIVVDMNSSDRTRDIAKKAGAKVFLYRPMGYVEPARNFAISKASGDWIFILDADEELPKSLVEKLKKIAIHPKADYYRIPRKNIIFGKWLKHSRWWPDFNIRFFKKGFVSWNELIHSVPMTRGTGWDMPVKEDYAITHHNYSSIEQYLERMNRYTDIQAKLLISEGHKFIWKELITKPLAEFLGRYFAAEGYKDGLHGLALALLQAVSELVLYLKVWQSEKFMEQAITLPEIEKELENATNETAWWIGEVKIRSKGKFSSIPERLKRKFIKKNV